MGIKAALSQIASSKSEFVERARAEFNYGSIERWIPARSNVLDVGAWTCYLGQMLQARKGCEMLALDVVDVNRTNVPFRKFDGTTLPAESGRFDVVLLLYVLHHAPDHERLLSEARRVLHDRGRLMVAEDSVENLWHRIRTVGFHFWLWVVTRMGWAGKFRKVTHWHAHFRKAGFRVSETVHLGPHLGRSLWPHNILFVLEKDSADGRG